MRFFDAALKGEENGFFDEPALVSYLQERIGPVPQCAERPGRWVADPAWPSPHVEARRLELDAPERSLRGLQLTGAEAGVWCGDGSPADGGGDQRPEDGASLCWDTPPLGERLELLGHAAAELELTADRPLALVVARLCEVAPDGTSTLIARGAAQPHASRRARPRRPDRAGRAGARPRPDAVDVLRGARRPSRCGSRSRRPTGRGSGRRPSR